jgi:lytic murein transglycosylase
MLRPLLVAAALALAAAPALAQNACHSQSFGAFLQEVGQQAAAEGVSQGTIEDALSDVRFDPGVVQKDRAQSVFAQSFLEFSGRMAEGYRINTAKGLIKANASTFARIEREFGVPAPVIAALWGLETDFGKVMGKGRTIESVATLAYDCRRSEMFRAELIDLLKIIDRGDLASSQMIGPWAGELGQFQFQPSYYLAQAVDYDGDGRRDLIRSTPDALASAANLLKAYGWQRGQPWLQEVRVPADMPWEQSDLAIRHPISQWAQWGVTGASGSLAGGAEASLLLPMGRNGPAFLAYPNFNVFLKWNQSLVYATTAAYLATRIAGAPRVSKGNGTVTPLGPQQLRTLQQLLAKRGYDVGEIDGKLGMQTRAGVRQAQAALGLPADSYPTPELIARLQSGE